MSIADFSLARLPRIVFGHGRLREVPDLAAQFGRRALLVTSRRALPESAHWQPLLAALETLGISWVHETVSGEPTPSLIDALVARHRHAGIEVVIGIGGGSVLDAGKAIAGLLPSGESVMNYLEGVGLGREFRGPALPYIAAPTTAGTGSEATKNAVLSEQGPQGYKKSFRHDSLVPQYAVVDPNLLATCPPELIAADGMDALTQLIESYVSAKANPFTDALAWSGIVAVKEGFLPAWRADEGPAADAGRAAMAYGALISGITLAQVGLGSVHGLASPLGAYFPIPHGACCGTLLATATDVNLRALRARAADHPALNKYAALGRLLGEADEPIKRGVAAADQETAWMILVNRLSTWTEQLNLPRLGHYGVTESDIPKIVAHSRGNSMQTNPILLTDAEITEIVQARL